VKGDTGSVTLFVEEEIYGNEEDKIELEFAVEEPDSVVAEFII
jgi:hypothetical protein